MNIFREAFNDLRERRLWPVAAALVVALVAIPVLLSTAASGSPPPAPLAAAPSGPAISGLPAVSVNTAPTTHSNLKGRGRDPFAQKHAKTAAAGGTTGTTGSTGSTSSTSSTGASGSGSTGAGGTTTTSTTTSTPATTPPPATTTTAAATVTPPPPPGLTATESYNISISITNSGGGLDTLDPVERLSALPSPQQPLLVELGVLKGGHRVVFAVEPGTVVHGPGNCAPGPIDCQIVSLGQGQIESLGGTSKSGVATADLFAVTAIKAQQHGSAAAADKLRKRASASGRRLLNAATLSTLSLFRYEPSLGAVVDLRNISVGGS